jgi:two-component SAPR family response regulator
MRRFVPYVGNGAKPVARDVMGRYIDPLVGKRVLIVEDEALIALEHRTSLAEAGAKVVATCATVASALECLEKANVDVAVVDFVLADSNSEPLQAVLKRRRIPFLVVSAYPRALVRTDPDQVVLRKPVSPEHLRSRVRAVCAA